MSEQSLEELLEQAEKSPGKTWSRVSQAVNRLSGLRFWSQGHLLVLRRVVSDEVVWHLYLEAPGDDYPKSWRQPGAALAQEAGPIACERVPTVKLSRESLLDKGNKLLGFYREQTQGEAEFDDKVYIETEADEMLVSGILSTAQVRRSVLGSLELFDFIAFFTGRSPLTMTGGKNLFKEGNYRERLRLCADYMVSIAQELPSIDVPEEFARRIVVPTNPKAPRGSLAYGLIGVLGFCSVPAFFLVYDIWSIFGDVHITQGLLAGGLLWLVSLPLLALMFRGSSKALKYFLTSAFFLGFGLPCCGVMLGVFINVLFAPGPLETLDVRILAKEQVRVEEGTNHYLKLKPVDESLEPVDALVNVNRWYHAKVGQEVRVKVGRGALGWVWLEEFVSPEGP